MRVRAMEGRAAARWARVALVLAALVLAPPAAGAQGPGAAKGATHLDLMVAVGAVVYPFLAPGASLQATLSDGRGSLSVQVVVHDSFGHRRVVVLPYKELKDRRVGVRIKLGTDSPPHRGFVFYEKGRGTASWKEAGRAQDELPYDYGGVGVGLGVVRDWIGVCLLSSVGADTRGDHGFYARLELEATARFGRLPLGR